MKFINCVATLFATILLSNPSFGGTGLAGGGISHLANFRIEAGNFHSNEVLANSMLVYSETILDDEQEELEGEHKLVLTEQAFSHLSSLVLEKRILELVQKDGVVRSYKVQPSLLKSTYLLHELTIQDQNPE